MLRYDEQFTFDQNIADLATALAGKVRDLESQRAVIENGPNHPELKRVDLAAIDAELDVARLHALAAADGMVFHDPRDMSGLDRDHQTWVAKARERGRLVNPSNFGPSLHASKDVPIRVVRGGDPTNLGAPTVSVQGGPTSKITRPNPGMGYTGL